MRNMFNRLIGKSEVESQPTKITWSGWNAEGKVDYDKHTAIGELINNILTLQSTNNQKYRFQLTIDEVSGEIWITDNFTGIHKQNMDAIHDLGKSYETSAILSEHGSGAKSALTWLMNLSYNGILNKIVSSVDGNDFYEKLPDYGSDISKWFPPKKCDPFMVYNTIEKVWEEQQTSGTQFYGIMGTDKLPKSNKWYQFLSTQLGAKYGEYLGKTLEIELIRLRDGVLQSHFTVNPIVPLKSHQPTPELPCLDKRNKLGADEWELDEVYTCDKTSKRVHVRAGWAPESELVEQYYIESKDEKYNPKNYESNPYAYGGSNVGMTYCKQWVPISNGKFKASSRGEAMIGQIDIISGIDTVKTKNGIVRDEDLDVFEEGLATWLKKKGFKVRARKTNFRISESKMEKTLTKRLRESKKLRIYLGVDNCEKFTNQWESHSGQPDIVGLIKKQPIFICEIKKEGGDDLWKAALQGMAYSMENNLKELLIVAQDDTLPTDLQTKLDIFEQNGWDIRYEQYQHLIGNF